jgi:hypothetical protein
MKKLLTIILATLTLSACTPAVIDANGLVPCGTTAVAVRKEPKVIYNDIERVTVVEQIKYVQKAAPIRYETKYVEQEETVMVPTVVKKTVAVQVPVAAPVVAPAPVAPRPSCPAASLACVQIVR